MAVFCGESTKSPKTVDSCAALYEAVGCHLKADALLQRGSQLRWEA